jgi:hypothetical protein
VPQVDRPCRYFDTNGAISLEYRVIDACFRGSCRTVDSQTAPGSSSARNLRKHNRRGGRPTGKEPASISHGEN